MTWQDVYNENRELDKLFLSFDDGLIIKKNKLELLVEIGEFANETKCFKYWSKKEINLDNLKEELADCFIMCLSFYNYLDIKDIDSIKILDGDILSLFLKLYELGVSFAMDDCIVTIKEIFNILLNIGYKLKLTDSDMVDSCFKKINKDKALMKEGY